MTAATFQIFTGIRVRNRGYFSNHHDTGSKTRKVAAGISKFSWSYVRFGALHNENNEIKTSRKLPAIRYTLTMYVYVSVLHMIIITAWRDCSDEGQEIKSVKSTDNQVIGGSCSTTSESMSQ